MVEWIKIPVITEKNVIIYNTKYRIGPQQTVKKIMVGRLLLIIVTTLLFSSQAEGASKVNKDCTWNGIRLSGNVQIVDRNPDIRIKIVEHFSDIKIKVVENFPTKCGTWKFVNSSPNFKIAIVNNNPDLKIRWENNFPGINH